MNPQVSIVILNYKHPEIIDVCLRSLEDTEGDYEVIVVDNGSDQLTVESLRQHKAAGRIDKLIECPENNFFSEGNNIGVRHISPGTEYILLLNSDVGFLRKDWLQKQLGWMEGTAVSRPTIWGLQPTVVKPGPFDVISIGWSHDSNVKGHARPEGWCLMIRALWWRDMSPDFPFHYGIDEMVTSIARDGGRVGVLFNYSRLMVHKEGGSGKETDIVNNRRPDLTGWFSDVEIETLDFTLDCPDCPGEREHLSYMEWD